MDESDPLRVMFLEPSIGRLLTVEHNQPVLIAATIFVNPD